MEKRAPHPSLSPRRGKNKEGVSFLWRFFSGESPSLETQQEFLSSRNPSPRGEGHIRKESLSYGNSSPGRVQCGNGIENLFPLEILLSGQRADERGIAGHGKHQKSLSWGRGKGEGSFPRHRGKTGQQSETGPWKARKNGWISDAQNTASGVV